MKIQTKEVYGLLVNGRQQFFDDPETAIAAVRSALATVTIDPADFSGSVTWDIEKVPATPLDKLLDDYLDELHDEGGADGVDRDDPFLLVESNVRGGYWLTTGSDPEDLVGYHLAQEYAEEWEIEGIYDTATAEPVHGETTTTVTY